MQTTRIIFRATQRLPLITSRNFGSTAILSERISDLIKHDHRQLEDYKNNILSAADRDDKIRWQNQFTWELARHSIAEELVVYPAMEKNIPDGRAMAEKDRCQHREVKELLKRFQDMYPDSPEFEMTLNTLWASLNEHIKDEEEADLPLLEQHIKPEDSEELADSFDSTKAFVPTRSHPSAPDRPPYETVAGLMAAPLDRLGDLFRRFPKETKKLGLKDKVVPGRDDGDVVVDADGRVRAGRNDGIAPSGLDDGIPPPGRSDRPLGRDEWAAGREGRVSP